MRYQGGVDPLSVQVDRGTLTTSLISVIYPTLTRCSTNLKHESVVRQLQIIQQLGQTYCRLIKV